MAVKETPSLLDQIHNTTKIQENNRHNKIIQEYQNSQTENEKLRKKIKCLERKRDISNKRTRELFLLAKGEAKRRDKINEQVSILKNERNNLNGEINHKERLKSRSKRDPNLQNLHKEQLKELKDRGNSLHNQVKLMASDGHDHQIQMLKYSDEGVSEKKRANAFHLQLSETKIKLEGNKKSKQRLKRQLTRSRKQLQNSE